MVRIDKLIIVILSLLLISCGEEETLYSNSVISSPHPIASETGKLIYSLGGNAFDAAVAAAFTLSVVEPSMSGIGGRLQAIYRKSDGSISGVDAMTQIPDSFNNLDMDNLESYGYKTIGIPGVVAGLLKLHEENGILDLETIMEPSIYVAEKGFIILPKEIKRIAGAKSEIEKFNGSKKYFLNKIGQPFKLGDKLIQQDLANTLTLISKNGKSGFYEGEVAVKMVDDIKSNGGYMSLEDLKNYQAIDSKVLTGKFNGYTAHSLYLPSYGAITIQILQIMDYLDIKSKEEWPLKVAYTSEIAYKNRPFQNNKDSLKSILSLSKAKIIANEINNYRFEISNSIDKDYSVSNTAHLTTADKYGNVVSLTQTIGPIMGSKVSTDGLGFLYNVTMGPYLGGYLNEINAGDRVSSNISPTLFSKNNEVILALGAAGGNKIPTAITQVSYRYLKQNFNLNESLSLPRVYKFNGPIQLESHIGVDRFYNNLDTDVYGIEKVPYEGEFGRIHAIALDTINNKWIGSSDPDWEGTVKVFK